MTASLGQRLLPSELIISGRANKIYSTYGYYLVKPWLGTTGGMRTIAGVLREECSCAIHNIFRKPANPLGPMSQWHKTALVGTWTDRLCLGG